MAGDNKGEKSFPFAIQKPQLFTSRESTSRKHSKRITSLKKLRKFSQSFIFAMHLSLEAIALLMTLTAFTRH